MSEPRVQPWHRTWRADPLVAAVADRHYSRQTIGSTQFTPPGRVLVLATAEHTAVWATSWPYEQFVHRQLFPDAWTCSLFRNEAPQLHRSSDLIIQAVAATRAVFGEPPPSGMVTMVDAARVQSQNPGYCFLCAGFQRVGYTRQRGLLVLRLPPEDMPPALWPIGAQMPLELPA